MVKSVGICRIYFIAWPGRKKALLKKYKENEDDNHHTENYLLLAKAFGSDEEVAEVQKIMKRSKSSTSQKDMDWMYKNINKYYKELTK